MTPYADFLYFGVLLYVVVPTLVLGLAGYVSKRWILIATLGMLAVQYGGRLPIAPETEIREIWIVAGYALFEWIVARGFLRVRALVRHRWPFYGALVLALLPLVVAKYVPLIAPTFQFGFLGISYVTFRVLDIIFCTQDRLISSLPAGQFFAYLFFFGTISAGPIDRYRRFDADWKRRRTRAEFLEDLDGAVHRIFTGFLYKFILAALVKQYWLDPVAAESGFLSTLSYMYAYSFYLFFDFAGYTAFAIGVSYLFGIHTPENFNRPFLARNMRDFWNRWNITLSWWLRDHVYMRFVMAAMKGRWFRNKYVASYLGLFLAFGLMGVWHGTAPHYLLYGLYHGALLSSHEAFSRWNKRHQLWGDGPLWRVAGIVGTFHCVCFGFLLFSGHLTSGAARRAAANDGAHGYAGQYEKASCEEIGGWAWDATNPLMPVSVDIYADGTRLATVPADLFRQDLADGGKGNGAHAFIFVPPPGLKDGWAHSTEVRIAGTDITLSDLSRSIVCGMNVEAMDGYDGSQDPATCAQISGWAWDSTEPDRTVDVDVYDNRMLLATVAADQVRTSPDGGKGRHGFVYLTPAQLKDGWPHSVSMRIAGSNVTLRNTPQIVTCSEPSMAQPATVAAPRSDAVAATDGAPRATGHSYADNGDGTITDLATGLVWEKKVELDGTGNARNLHDADNCYPWAGSCATGGGDCRVDADCEVNGPCLADDCQASAPDGLTIFKWVALLNSANFAGHGDWRLPTSTELYSIVNPFEEGDPAARTAFNGASCGGECGNMNDPACSCNHLGLYWAAPKSAPSPDDSWMMLFYCNGNLFLDLKSNRYHVRAVRGGS
jgi:membrane protein involved in D-alanine export